MCHCRRYNVTLSGTENLDPKRTYLIFPNHPALIDPFVLTTELYKSKVIIRPLIDESFFSNRLFKHIFMMFNAVRVPDFRRINFRPLLKVRPDKKIAVFEEGQPLEKRRCPIDGKTVKHCIGCPTCAIMNGFGGAGAFSDGKYNLTNDFGGTLYEYIGKKQAMELMHYVDEINVSHGGENTKLYSTANSAFKTRCLQCGLHLLDASVRHLGTDINFVVLKNLFAELEPKVDFHFRTPVRKVLAKDGGYEIVTDSSASHTTFSIWFSDAIPGSGISSSVLQCFRS